MSRFHVPLSSLLKVSLLKLAAGQERVHPYTLSFQERGQECTYLLSASDGLDVQVCQRCIVGGIRKQGTIKLAHITHAMFHVPLPLSLGYIKVPLLELS